MSLDKRIEAIFSRTAREMVDAIRSSLVEEVARVTGGRAARGGKASSSSKGRYARRSTKQIAAGVSKIIAFIGKNPGLRTEEILRKIGGDTSVVKDALARLRASGKVKTKGIKRAMTYQLA